MIVNHSASSYYTSIILQIYSKVRAITTEVNKQTHRTWFVKLSAYNSKEKQHWLILKQTNKPLTERIPAKIINDPRIICHMEASMKSRPIPKNQWLRGAENIHTCQCGPCQIQRGRKEEIPVEYAGKQKIVTTPAPNTSHLRCMNDSCSRAAFHALIRTQLLKLSAFMIAQSKKS